MNIFPLRSGSRGNAVLIFSDKTKILVDCGISGKTAADALSSLCINACDLDAIVVTHEHSDHISGIGVMARRYNLPIWANCETWDAMRPQLGKLDDCQINQFKDISEFEVGDIEVKPFHISHDAANPVGYSFSCCGETVSVATDIGKLTKDFFAAVKGSRTVLLEANHDINMLEIGKYPLSLKRRIRGNLGHLSNDEAGKAAEFLVKLGTENILLGHLSEENNYPDLALQTVAFALSKAGIHVGKDVLLGIAHQSAVSRV